MKAILLISVLLLSGCSEWTVPKYHRGQNVIVHNKTEGMIIDIRNWYTDYEATADYKIMFDSGAVEWFDEEVINSPNTQ